MSTELKVVVWKELNPEGPFARMWRGHCLACDKYSQFWFFGATLGYMLEHIRRCDGFRYGRSLADRPIRPVSSADAFQTSGQEKRGDRDSAHAESLLPPQGWPKAPTFGFRSRSW